VESIPRSWFAAIATLFLLVALLPMLLRPSVTLTGELSGLASGRVATCISPWSRMTGSELALVYVTSVPAEAAVFATPCENAIDARQNVAVGLLLLGGMFAIVFVRSLVRRSSIRARQ
jgi:hypothetical protein